MDVQNRKLHNHKFIFYIVKHACSTLEAYKISEFEHSRALCSRTDDQKSELLVVCKITKEQNWATWNYPFGYQWDFPPLTTIHHITLLYILTTQSSTMERLNVYYSRIKNCIYVSKVQFHLPHIPEICQMIESKE